MNEMFAYARRATRQLTIKIGESCVTFFAAFVAQDLC